jgi:hypothetical protein
VIENKSEHQDIPKTIKIQSSITLSSTQISAPRTIISAIPVSPMPGKFGNKNLTRAPIKGNRRYQAPRTAGSSRHLKDLALSPSSSCDHLNMIFEKSFLNVVVFAHLMIDE